MYCFGSRIYWNDVWLMLDFQVGDVVAGRYEIKQVLGAGGMGKVYRARQVDLGRDVALKVPSQAVLESPEILARFSREAKTVAKLLHENIVQVYEYYHKDDAVFIAMEFVEGQDLKEFCIYPPTDLTVGDLSMIFALSCEGLAHAHEHGIVHRDVKPHNIMVARLPKGKWRVKVMDFGIAHIDPAGQYTGMGDQLTQTGQALGTPSYMSPEQIRGTGVSALSDIYSFGCVMYYVFTRQTVFTGSGLTVAVSHLNESPPSIRSHNPALTEEFDALIASCLEKDPNNRPKDASELAGLITDALESIVDVPMSEVWRQSGQAPESTMPIPSIRADDSEDPTAPRDGLIEVQTQATIAQTTPTGESYDATAPMKRIDESRSSQPATKPIPAPAPTPSSAGGGRAASPPPATPATPAMAGPAKKKFKLGIPVVLSIIGALALIIGFYAVAVLTGGDDEEGPDGNGQVAMVEPTPTATPTPAPQATPQPTATPTPEATTPPVAATEIPSTPKPSPTQRVGTPLPPTPEPSPTPHLGRRRLAQLADQAAETTDLQELARSWSEIMNLKAYEDPAFQEAIIQTADGIARKIAMSPEMVKIASGSFTMGADDGEFGEGPAHNVRLTAYDIGKYEVSAIEFSAFLNSRPSVDEARDLFTPTDQTNVIFDEKIQRFVPREGRELHPANGVDWFAAEAYCNWLSSESGRHYHLPTEAQWERAARGTFESTYPWGNTPPTQSSANFASNETLPVTFLRDGASAARCLNMAGNVAEWCSDWFSEDTYQSPDRIDPTGPELGQSSRDRRVLRGGSYFSVTPKEIRTTYRERSEPDEEEPYVGFRLARTD
ncbi:SUMF1/EgtB/PvdO family nonheme iron enzyme [bacterium]|nr:SUMF1/EgtB/PvdO family nonheme iron enzyme [bacterium]